MQILFENKRSTSFGVSEMFKKIVCKSVQFVKTVAKKKEGKNERTTSFNVENTET